MKVLDYQVSQEQFVHCLLDQGIIFRSALLFRLSDQRAYDSLMVMVVYYRANRR